MDPQTVFLLESFAADDFGGAAWWPVAVYATREAAAVAALTLDGEANVRPVPMVAE